MGTEISVLLPTGREELASAVWGTFAEWDATLSRFRPDSELTYLNRHAGETVRVSELLYRVTEHALDAARATDGLFDPTILPALRKAGYDRTFEEIAATRRASTDDRAAAATADRPRDGAGREDAPWHSLWRFIRLDPLTRHIRLPAGCALDYGGIAKGMAVDAAVELLALLGVDCALVDAGGDLRVLGTPAGQDGFPVAVPTPRAVLRVSLQAGALATSGIAHRRWPTASGEAHHLIDPGTGRSAQTDLWAVTVAAGSCEQAEVAAKAAFFLGPDAGGRFLERHGLAGLFALRDGRLVATARWPKDSVPTEFLA